MQKEIDNVVKWTDEEMCILDDLDAVMEKGRNESFDLGQVKVLGLTKGGALDVLLLQPAMESLLVKVRKSQPYQSGVKVAVPVKNIHPSSAINVNSAPGATGVLSINAWWLDVKVLELIADTKNGRCGTCYLYVSDKKMCRADVPASVLAPQKEPMHADQGTTCAAYRKRHEGKQEYNQGGV